MDFYTPRPITFRAWDVENKLLVRLDSISCIKGELFKKDHILLQYTGMLDKHGEQLFEMDVVLIGSTKHLVQWSPDRGCWSYCQLTAGALRDILSKQTASTMLRLCSYFESSEV
jgi:hypothetical protein